MRIAFAVFDGVGDRGEDAYLSWAAGRTRPDPAEDRRTWRSARQPGAVTVATLFGLARQHGYRAPDTGFAAAAQVQKAPAATAVRRAAEAEDYRRRADAAARRAAALWDAGIEEASGPYLARKGAGAHGVRHLADGTLLVPMRNAAGELQNLQQIAPLRREGQPEKRYLAGGRKVGLFHLIGHISDEVVLLCEGYATGATLHEASGHAVAVAFDAGNLPHVARALRERYPRLPLLVCADDDRATEARTGSNPGRQKAATAARVAATADGPAGVVYPAPLGDGGTDFNDLAQQRGHEAVKALIDAACASPLLPPRPARRAKEPRSAPRESSAEPADDGPDRYGFRCDDEGVWHVARDRDGERKPHWLCAPLQVAALSRGGDSNGWGYLLRFSDPDGQAKGWNMPSALLSGDGCEWIARLREMGLAIAVGALARTLLAKYVSTRRPDARVTSTDKVGWHGPVFVLPSGAIGESDGAAFVYQSDSDVDDHYREQGTLVDWQQHVAALCRGNPGFVFALCCAFAGSLLRDSGLESGGIHLRGASRIGKTACLLVAASVWGPPSYMQRWRTTDNALEAVAAQHNDGLLILDEFGQLDPHVAGDAAYMLANEQGKGRATRAGQARRRRAWRLLFLSSGETGLAAHMAEAGKRVRPGQEVRMVDVPLDGGAEAPLGAVFEQHGHDGAAALVEALKAAAARYHGTAGRAWLRWLCAHQGSVTASLAARIERHRDDFVSEAASSQVRTVGVRFALIAAAGELAAQAGITTLPEGEAAAAVRRAYNAWLDARGHLESGEVALIVHQVRGTLARCGDAQFQFLHRANADDSHAPVIRRLGYKIMVDGQGTALKVDAGTDFCEKRTTQEASERHHAMIEYLVTPEAWSDVVCKGLDPQRCAEVLRARGHLKCDSGRLQRSHRVPTMGKVRFFHVTCSLFEDEL